VRSGTAAAIFRMGTTFLVVYHDRVQRIDERGHRPVPGPGS
jgi:hypothetical protein